MADPRQGQVSRRARRALRAVLPIGIVLLVLWLARIAWDVASGGPSGMSVATTVLGLINAVILIVTGVMYRRELPPER